jgi:uncharacterized protein YigE (DUF2233 family)
MKAFKTISTLAIVCALVFVSFTARQNPDDSGYVSYTADPKSQDIRLYWKNDSGRVFGSIQSLKSELDSKHKTLLFAMNGGMYKSDHSPQGLFIQSGKTITALDTSSGKGNFYLKPNGVFYMTRTKEAFICKTSNFRDDNQIAFATQSGPMLVIDGKIHPGFTKGSGNLNIRNGAGILPDGRIVFAMSKKQINLYDFASYFKNLGCKNALYLDGFVSRAYLPEKNWTQTDGYFGVLIGITN